MTHKRYRKFWNLLRLWLIVRELKALSRKRGPRFGALAALALCLGCSYVGVPVKDPVVVVMRDGLPACSGFAIGHDRILTAAHCITGRGETEVVTETQWTKTASEFTPVVIEWVDLTRDIAVLSGKFNFPRVVDLRPPVQGEPVSSRSVYFGAVTEGNILLGEGYFLDTTLSVDFGWSGSPVFGLDGKAVGFVDACRVREHHVCMPASALIGVLP